MNYAQQKITIPEAEEILFDLYNIRGTASPLPGYVDFNFRIKIEGEEGYILKISRVEENKKYLEYQQHLLQFIENSDEEMIAPRAIKDKDNHLISEIKDRYKKTRCVRLLSWVSGKVWSAVNPQLEDLRLSIGSQCGTLTKVLQGFKHPEAHYNFEWDIAQSLWTKKQLHLFETPEKEILMLFQNKFEAVQHSYQLLRKSIVHNDPNDNNIIVTPNIEHPKAKAAIDYGDAMHTQTINDLAILCAYGTMGHNDPLEASLAFIKGYHSSFPLLENELAHLFTAIAMRLVIIVTRAAMSKIEEPDNEYLWISEQPAWEVLQKWSKTSDDFAHYSFRDACGFSPHPNEKQFKKWAATIRCSLTDLFPSIHRKDIELLDLSVSSTWIGHQADFNNIDLFQYKLDQLQKERPTKIISGGYLETRPLYTSNTYDKIGNSGPESRTIHLGIDFWLPTNTPVHALFDGEIALAVNDYGNKEYGGLVVLKHKEKDIEFYTLYGHLDPESILHYKKGDLIQKVQKIGVLGDQTVNGNWAPHLHFQIMLSLLDYTTDFPGVAYANQIDVWKSICVDPNALFCIKNLHTKKSASNEELIGYRRKHLGKGLSLQYKEPIKMVRGEGAYLLDQFGRKYLDTVNNVAHVGHEHPNVIKAAQQQIAILNTNSRYLHENINILTQEILATLPPELSVVHFVNSGSEANELAIRMAKTVTGKEDVIASEVGYHGNTNTCVAISSYKFDGKGGKGAPEHTHIFPLPDAFRGKYRGKNTGEKYAEEVQNCIDTILKKGDGVSALIVEPIISCGGQIELPEGFLSKAYSAVRKAGGLCISDEVQVGCGRLGTSFWGFQLHNIIPDIITIGKPIGNGHPLAAVVCTEAVASRFANGMEFFNTFGGNPVSCAIGTAVLQTVKNEKLQENALKVGAFLKEQLLKLAEEFPIIGDVRGQGFFLGMELVDAQKKPLPKQADYLINRMKAHGILMSSDGLDHNVLKIKPPLVFSKENAQQLLWYLRKILAEDVMTS